MKALIDLVLDSRIVIGTYSHKRKGLDMIPTSHTASSNSIDVCGSHG